MRCRLHSKVGGVLSALYQAALARRARASRTASHARLFAHRVRPRSDSGRPAHPLHSSRSKMHLFSCSLAPRSQSYRFPVELWINDKLKQRTAALETRCRCATPSELGAEPRSGGGHADTGQGRTFLSAVRRSTTRRAPVPTGLAASLREPDFDVVMIDAAIEPDYQDANSMREASMPCSSASLF